MGSVIKRGKTYHIVFDGPPKADGSRNQIWRACKGMNSKEATIKLHEEERKVRLGIFIEYDEKVSGYLREWLSQVEGTLAATTMREYRTAVENHIIPELGSLDLQKLTAPRIGKFYQKLQETLAPKTVKNIHCILHRALAQAVRWQQLTANPAEAVDPPKVTRPQIQIADQKELWQVLDRLKGREWYLPTFIALATGMRRGEVLALQWQDFDEDNKVLIVRRSLARVRDSEVIEKETKSGRVRVVAIPAALVNELTAQKKQSAHTAPADWICCKADGRHLAPGGLTLAFHRAANKLNLSISFHSIRHMQATTLIMAGMPVKVVSERLGHATTQITQDIYTHVLPHMQQEAANLIGQAFFTPENSVEEPKNEDDVSKLLAKPKSEEQET